MKIIRFSSVGVTGDIYVNGRPRNKHLFHKLSCYIMQDDLVQMGLTVNEAMNVAANLKLGSELNAHEKKLVVCKNFSDLFKEIFRFYIFVNLD